MFFENCIQEKRGARLRVAALSRARAAGTFRQKEAKQGSKRKAQAGHISRWPPVGKSLPYGSFDGHNNFISAHHVQARTRSRFDSARVFVQAVNFRLKREIAVA